MSYSHISPKKGSIRFKRIVLLMPQERNVEKSCDLDPQVGVRRPHQPKRPMQGALAAKPEVEIWWRPVVLTERPRLPIRLRVHYGVYLAPLPRYQGRILTLAHCNSRRTWKFSHSHTRSAFFFRNSNKLFLTSSIAIQFFFIVPNWAVVLLISGKKNQT